MGKLQVVCFWCWASGMFWRQSEGIDQGWLLKLSDCKGLFLIHFRQLVVDEFLRVANWEKQREVAKNGCSFSSTWAHPLPNVSHMMWQVADATGHAAQPNEAIACGIGCHVWERVLDQEIASPWVNRCVSKFGTSPKSSIKMLDYLWSRNHRFLFLPPNFETHLLFVDQSTQLRLFSCKMALLSSWQLCIVYVHVMYFLSDMMWYAYCLLTIEPNNSVFTYEAMAGSLGS